MIEFNIDHEEGCFDLCVEANGDEVLAVWICDQDGCDVYLSEEDLFVIAKQKMEERDHEEAGHYTDVVKKESAFDGLI